MNEPPTPTGWRFSLRDLFVAVGCVALLLSLIVLPIKSAREKARQNQCANNLKQILLGVHNFHDTIAGLPPLSISEGRPSFFVQLEPFSNSPPFVSHGSNSAGVSAFDVGYDGPSGLWSRLTKAERQYATAACKWTRCPSRGRELWSVVTPEDALYFGPTGDYAVVFFNGRMDWKSNSFRAVKDWEQHYDPCNKQHVDRQFGAVRLALVGCDTPGGPDFGQWKPRNLLWHIKDGSSNTLIVGEKYVRHGELNRYADDPERQDGTYLFEARGRRSAAVARNLWYPLAEVDDPRFRWGKKASPQRDFGFGGPHAGGVQFALADGAVKTVARNINRVVQYRLAHCQDGLAPQEIQRGAPEDMSADDPHEKPVPTD